MPLTLIAETSMEKLVPDGGVVALLAVLTYAIIDKVVVPLLKERKEKSDDKGSSPTNSERSGKWDTQSFINDSLTKRISHIEKELDRVRNRLSEISTNLEVSRVILEQLEEKHRSK